MKRSYNHEESLRQRNELTKLKLQAEFGGQFGDDTGINPLIENIFLNNVLEFERTMAESRQVSVHHFIGNPSYKLIEQIPDEELSSALEEVMTTLNEKNIFIDTICGIPEREMYRFITQELFLTETESVLPKGLMKFFIYEEFHPNHEHDIRVVTADFIKNLADVGEELNQLCIWTDFDPASKKAHLKLVNKLNNFRSSFDRITIEDFTIHSVNITEDKATVEFNFRFTLLPAGTKTSHEISSPGTLSFIYQNEQWSISSAKMKGVL